MNSDFRTKVKQLEEILGPYDVTTEYDEDCINFNFRFESVFHQFYIFGSSKFLLAYQANIRPIAGTWLPMFEASCEFSDLSIIEFPNEGLLVNFLNADSKPKFRIVVKDENRGLSINPICEV